MNREASEECPTGAAIARTLEPRLGVCQPAELQLIAETTRNRVFRCSVDCAQSSIHVVVKQLVHEPSNERFFTEWASLQFLGARETHTLVPQFFGGNAEERFFVLEDYGVAWS